MMGGSPTAASIPRRNTHEHALRRDRHRQRPGRTVSRRPPRRSRHEDGAGRARAPWRHLRQRWLHPDQDPGGERPHRPRRPARRRLRRRGRAGPRRHEGGEGAQGCRRQAIDRRPRQVDRRDEEPEPPLGPGALHRAACDRGERRDAGGAEDLPQCRRQAGPAHVEGYRRGAGAEQHLDDGRRHPAGASADRRRQLHRPGVRAMYRRFGTRDRARVRATG